MGNGVVDAAKFVGGWTDSDGYYVLVNQGSTNVNLSAFQWGYNFTGAPTWSNPLQPTNDTTGVDFTGMVLIRV